MTGQEQWAVITNISEDDSQLEMRARDMIPLPAGESLVIDKDWLEGSIISGDGDEIAAVLLKSDGKRGFLRLIGDGVPSGVKDITTEEDSDFILAVIRPGQQATCLGLTTRVFRRLKGCPELAHMPE